jgi:A/G-specific adenine glycosylase
MKPGIRSARFDFRSLPRVRRDLLSWYDQNRRDLPWRNTREPYRVWISEIMLQQTRVAAVLARYQQFLKRFPSVQKLASARESSVLAEWSGLGYYRRARNLHAAAKVVAREGKFPSDTDGWRALPGIGRYTAAAIASIAFNKPVAVLDGNVERVLRRLLGGTQTNTQLWKRAQEFLDRKRPGDFNQAMMELGATVCLPSEPRCTDCPLRRVCRTRGRGKFVSGKPRQQKREITYALVRRADSILLVRRSRDANLMPGMWELPEAVSPGKEDKLLFSVRHSITVTDFRVSVIEPQSVSQGMGRWSRIPCVNTLALTGLTKKILRKAAIIQPMRT